MKCKVCKKEEIWVYNRTKCWDCFVISWDTKKEWKGGL